MQRTQSHSRSSSSPPRMMTMNPRPKISRKSRVMAADIQYLSQAEVFRAWRLEDRPHRQGTPTVEGA
jgi:hypothetical protein